MWINFVIGFTVVMDTRSFYGRKRNVTYRLAGGEERGSDEEEVAFDSDSEYLPEVQPLA